MTRTLVASVERGPQPSLRVAATSAVMQEFPRRCMEVPRHQQNHLYGAIGTIVHTAPPRHPRTSTRDRLRKSNSTRSIATPTQSSNTRPDNNHRIGKGRHSQEPEEPRGHEECIGVRATEGTEGTSTTTKGAQPGDTAALKGCASSATLQGKELRGERIGRTHSTRNLVLAIAPNKKHSGRPQRATTLRERVF